MKNVFIAALFCFSPLVVNAQSEFQKYCHSPTDQSTKFICNLSQDLGIPPLKVTAAMVFASVEMTGAYCNFSFTRKFIETRINLYNDNEIARAATYLITMYNNKPPPGFTGNKSVYCHTQYETFGPRSTEDFYRK